MGRSCSLCLRCACGIDATQWQNVVGSDVQLNPRNWVVEMKKILLAGVAGVALITTAPANAADLGPLYRAPPAIVPVRVFSWTGCYIGGNIGWGWGRDIVSIPNLGETTGVPELFHLTTQLRGFSCTSLPTTFCHCVASITGVSLPSVTGDTKGVVGGGQVGCN